MDNQNQKKILLIEDDEFIRDMYKEELEASGFKVSAFGTGKECFEALDQEQFDLVLLDIMLPDTNGLEILKRMKSSDKTKNIKVVILTNLGQESIIKEGFQLGAAGYLIKVSYNPDQMVEEVKKFISS